MAAITVMETKSRPTYANALRNPIYSSARMEKLSIIRAVRPASLLCHDGVFGIDKCNYI